MCVCVCVFAKCWGIHAGRQTYRRHEEQTGRDCTRRAQNRQKSVDLWGGEYHIYIYIHSIGSRLAESGMKEGLQVSSSLIKFRAANLRICIDV